MTFELDRSPGTKRVPERWIVVGIKQFDDGGNRNVILNVDALKDDQIPLRRQRLSEVIPPEPLLAHLPT